MGESMQDSKYAWFLLVALRRRVESAGVCKVNKGLVCCTYEATAARIRVKGFGVARTAITTYSVLRRYLL